MEETLETLKEILEEMEVFQCGACQRNFQDIQSRILDLEDKLGFLKD